jgi:hypothetical protein
MNRVGLAVSILACTACLADTHKLPVTRDVGICAHKREVALNTGGNSRVRVKGNEHYYLFDFDAEKLRTSKVTRATLHVKLARGHLREVAFCTVPCKWVEGTATGKSQNGSTCFTHVRYPTHTWPLMGSTRPPHGDAAHTGGTMLDATLNSPYMRWEPAEVKAGEDGWLEIPIHPDLVQACAVGLSHGLVMSDEKGQTRENHDILTREQANATPYLTVEAQPWHVAGPLKRPAPQVRPLPDGRIEIDASWPMFDGKPLGHRAHLALIGSTDLGPPLPEVEGFVTLSDRKGLATGFITPGWDYKVRVDSCIGPQWFQSEAVKVTAPPRPETPQPPKVEPPARMQDWGMGGWSWWIVPATAKVDATLKIPPPAIVAGAAPLEPGVAAPVTPRNAWVSCQVVFFPPEGMRAPIKANLTELRRLEAEVEGNLPAVHWPARLFRIWHVPKAGDWHPEVCVPLKPGEEFGIPWEQNRLPEQINQAILVDIWIPADARAGPYAAALVISQGGKTVAQAPLRIQVADAVLPDELRVIGDMNTYGSPAGAMGVKTDDAKAFMEMERKYYRLAHAHRMTLNVLPYSQSGIINWRGAPKIKADGSFDWTEWDERYGPLLSGSAFSAKAGYLGPGADTPIHHMYLPFHENWPAKLADHFRPWPPPKDYDKFLIWSAEVPPIEECLDGTLGPYGWAWRKALVSSVSHAHKLGDGKTRFQAYLNNKYYFRRGKDPGDRAYSLWLLDEPMFADDFLALRHFGRLVQSMRHLRSMTPGEDMVDYRIDISRPTHQRQWLDGLVDLNVCADQLYEQRRLVDYRKRRFGEEYWNYRMPESFSDAGGLPWAVWPVRSYCWGATGTLPWQTIASDGDLREADATALMYPGRKFALDQPIPSLRMKAWREGLQVAELLRMLREKNRWTDAQLRAFVGQACGLDGWQDGRDPKPDAAIVTFAGMDAARLEALKRAALSSFVDK